MVLLPYIDSQKNWPMSIDDEEEDAVLWWPGLDLGFKEGEAGTMWREEEAEESEEVEEEGEVREVCSSFVSFDGDDPDDDPDADSSCAPCLLVYCKKLDCNIW